MNVPAQIFGAIGFYDERRDRVLVVAGSAAGVGFVNTVWELVLAGTPSWHELQPGGSSPSPRQNPTGAYDPVGDRFVMNGGVVDGVILDDTWSLELSPELRWVQLETSVTKPGPRWAATSIYDPESRRLVMFGGLAGLFTGTALDEVWTLDLQGPPAWTQLLPVGDIPSAQYGPSSVYDPLRHRMVVNGMGDYYSEPLLKTWALSLEGEPTWRLLQPETAPARRNHLAAVYDPRRDRQIFFGGDNGYAFGDTWALDWRHAGQSTPVAPVSGRVAIDPQKDLALAVARATTGEPLTVRFSTPGSETARLELFDLSGRRLDQLDLVPRTEHGLARIASAQHLIPGVYFLRLAQGAALSTRRIVVLPSGSR